MSAKSSNFAASSLASVCKITYARQQQGGGTAVESVSNTPAISKVLENGQLFIIRNNVKYNANGNVVK